MHYIIVKHAQDTVWPFYYDVDPKLGSQDYESCHDTYTGKEVGIEPMYTDVNKAKEHCEQMNTSNPVGCYDVCVMSYPT